MSTVLALLTTTRDDLFDISHTLADTFDQACLKDPKNPVIVTVRGSQRSGKKIIADALCRELISFEDKVHYRGMKGFDEFWHGRALKGDGDVEFNYLDAAWRFDYSSSYHTPELKLKRPKHEYLQFLDDFLKQRTKGGLTVIQNGDEQGGGCVNIWIEKRPHIMPIMIEGSRVELDHPLMNAFCRATCDNVNESWVRYVEIDIASLRLVTGKKMRDAVAILTSASTEVVKALEEGRAPMPRPYTKAMPLSDGARVLLELK